MLFSKLAQALLSAWHGEWQEWLTHRVLLHEASWAHLVTWAAAALSHTPQGALDTSQPAYTTDGTISMPASWQNWSSALGPIVQTAAQPKRVYTAGPSLDRSGGEAVSASRTLSANSQQQAVRVVISPQKDETSQTDGCHSREDTCK